MTLRDWVPSTSTMVKSGLGVLAGCGLIAGTLLYYFQLNLIYPAGVPEGKLAL